VPVSRPQATRPIRVCFILTPVAAQIGASRGSQVYIQRCALSKFRLLYQPRDASASGRHYFACLPSHLACSLPNKTTIITNGFKTQISHPLPTEIVWKEVQTIQSCFHPTANTQRVASQNTASTVNTVLASRNRLRRTHHSKTPLGG
jgi:hypothetical protein